MVSALKHRSIVEKRLNIDGGCCVSREGNSITISYNYAGRVTRKTNHFYADDIRALAEFVRETDTISEPRQSSDFQQWADETACLMRDYYEANRPLRWWEKRNPSGSWGRIADDLMLGLLSIALGAEQERRALAEQEAA
jgi:hypothetical protein